MASSVPLQGYSSPEKYVQETPATVLCDFLERHRPKLVNGIESELIPRTNNAVKLVIRRFDPTTRTCS